MLSRETLINKYEKTKFESWYEFEQKFGPFSILITSCRKGKTVYHHHATAFLFNFRMFAISWFTGGQMPPKDPPFTEHI